MEKHHKFSIWYVLFAVWIALILQNVIVHFFSVERVPYSEFIKALEAGKVMEVAVMQDRLQGKMKVKKDGQEMEKVFSTVRVDADLSELLEKYNVSFKGVMESNFLKNLASWVVPIFLSIGIWYFMMKRLASQQRSFLTLGKKKAKVYMEDEVSVTFDDAAGVDEAKEELGERGVVVSNVEPGSPAAEAGLRQGDLIKEVNRGPIQNLDDYTRMTEKAKKGESVVLLIKRGVSTFYVVLKPASQE